MSIASLNMQRIVRSVNEIFKPVSLFHQHNILNNIQFKQFQSLVITDEEDQWFKITHDHLEEVERVLGQLKSEFAFLAGDKKDVAKSLIFLNRSLSALALVEENSVLALTLDKLADLHANFSTIQNYDAEMGHLLVRSLIDQIQSIRVSFFLSIGLAALMFIDLALQRPHCESLSHLAKLGQQRAIAEEQA
jgi:hypothetical protein